MIVTKIDSKYKNLSWILGFLRLYNTNISLLDLLLKECVKLILKIIKVCLKLFKTKYYSQIQIKY